MKNHKLGHYCGVVGLFSREPSNIPQDLYFPLFALQHRGQESAGIAYREDDQTVVHKDLGMVSSVLGKYLEKPHSSHAGIGHVRYSTHGGNKKENAQPLVVNSNKGEIAIAHNGNLTNTKELKEELFQEGAIFQTSSDTEVILHLISRCRKDGFHEALMHSLGRLKGAFSMVALHDDSLIAIRDPWGFRPLYIGWKNQKTYLASESVALDMMQVTEYRSVQPGEVIIINQEGESSYFIPRNPREGTHQCIFEMIYFARPDSEIYDSSVHNFRKRIGAALAKKDRELLNSPHPGGDIVVPVPDSGTIAALGYAQHAEIPFEMGLTRNHYTGRSFILPSTAERELAVRLKLHPVRSVIQGRRVFLIDDSLVRGTTAKILVKLIKEAGAAEVHLRLSAPEIRWPCFFGIDIPTRKELISNSLSPEELSKHVGADSLQFLQEEDLKTASGSPGKFCFSCFNGDYPFEVPLRPEARQATPRDKNRG
ncbi:amidophosphoribosyltransferase [Salinispira pacifica]|uniref:Amidophosphoribosyltransferase n=1 Tax=Salinispira pacifica TaxID=1307761 RepID=V5WG00_9SPIO|nr:amidophosphoribosyltransferase [Salinispira pacifica]AHC14762.1 Amidophosphoribosyltransferase [Salinispira pacifica]